MNDGQTPPSSGESPSDADLWAVVLAVAVTDAVVLAPFLSETALRPVVVFPFVLVVPGYALVAALFPADAARVAEGTAPGGPADPRLPTLGRVVLAFGGSVGVVAAVTLTLDFTDYGFQTVPVLAGVSVSTLALVGVAAYRRRSRGTDRRAGVAPTAAVGRIRRAARGGTRLEAILSVVAVASVLLAAGAVYAGPGPDGGASNGPTVALLGTGADGPAMADYPRNLTRGEPVRPSLMVTGGDRQATVTVVVLLQDLSDDGASVVSSTELDRFEVSVGANETRVVDHAVVPTRAGDPLRLAYLVYEGDPPPTPTAANADREVHLWVGVTEER
ncbi:MAG: DUF1616 domain-containing protein [Halobacteriaceae archaeon]